MFICEQLKQIVIPGGFNREYGLYAAGRNTRSPIEPLGDDLWRYRELFC
jgi:hypothetical protein